MNKKTLPIIFYIVLLALIGVAIYFVVDKKAKLATNQSGDGAHTNNTVPPNHVTPISSTTPHLEQDQVYENQYIKVIIPPGWVTKQVANNPAALNIIKGNYILFINARARQASGVPGGRFEEFAGGAPSVDAVIVEHPGGPCGISETSMIVVNGVPTKRTDYYVSSSDQNEFCRKPTVAETVWYFSFVGNGINYFNIPNDSGALGWVVTMAYDSKIVNSFPIKSSLTLNKILSEMTSIVKTLAIKVPTDYIPR